MTARERAPTVRASCANCNYLSLGYVCQRATSKNYARLIENAVGACDQWETMTIETRRKWLSEVRP